MVSKTCNRVLQVEEVGAVRVVHLPGPALLDPLVITQIGHELARIVSRLGEGPRLLLHFGRVEQLSSMMLGIVGGVQEEVAAAGGRLAVCGLRQQLAVPFRITGLDRLLHRYTEEPEALMSF